MYENGAYIPDALEQASLREAGRVVARPFSPWAIEGDPRILTTPGELPDDPECPHCHGSGQERDMESGRSIVCRECSGSGRRE